MGGGENDNTVFAKLSYRIGFFAVFYFVSHFFIDLRVEVGEPRGN